jgi:hypothetical protein
VLGYQCLAVLHSDPDLASHGDEVHVLPVIAGLQDTELRV